MSPPNARQQTLISPFKSVALWAVLVMAIGLSLSVAGFLELQQITKERLFLETEKNVRAHIEQIQTNINISLDSLSSVAALYQAAGDISTRQLAQIFNTETHYHSGTVGLAWIPRVSESEKTQFEQKVRAEGISNYHIYEVTGHGLPRAADGNEAYFPVRAVYPALATDLRLGLNLAAISTRQHVMLKARHTQQTAITDRVSIFNGDQHIYGFQAFHPLFRGGDDAYGDIVGYVVGLYDLQGLFGNVFRPDEARLALYDSGSASQQLLYSSSPAFSTVKQIKSSQDFHWSFPVQVADKQWIVSVFPDIKRRDSSTGVVPLAGLVAGLLMTSLLTLYLVISLIRTRQLSVLTDNLAGTTNQLDIQRRLKQEANRANQAKSNMLRAASHDLRQPLHTIGLLTSLLKSSQDMQQQQQLAIKIALAVDNMEQMFGALLDISMLESGGLKIDEKAFSINSLLERIYFDYEVEAEQKGLELRLVYSSATVRTDQSLLERMLRNLISNAIRYTQHGSVLIGCRRQNSQLRICVLDSGIGMSHEAQQHIAEEFYREESARQLAQQGLGLGLAIVARTAEALHLGFDFHSELGKGSCFYIDVPYADALPEEPAAALSNTSEPLHQSVWVMEDNADARYGLEQLLRDWHCTYQGMSSQQELNKLLADSPQQPDAIIADYHLGQETGLDLIRQVRDHFNAAIPAIIVTASVELEALIRSQQPPVAMLLKPVKAHQLHDFLSRSSEH